MSKFAVLILVLPLLLFSQEFKFPQNVKLGGELEQRIRLTEKRLMNEPFEVDLVVQDVARKPELTRRFEEYEGDVSGRTLGAWSYMSRLLGERPARLDEIFAAILPNQAAAGYFGQDQKKIDWDYWGRQTFGHGRLLGGLVQYYHLTQDKRALDAATKLGDYFVKNIPTWTGAFAENPWTNQNDWIEWQDEKTNRQHFVKTHKTSILESLVMLYDIQPKQDYLDAATALVGLFPEFGHYHSHSYMNTMTGMAMLYAHTGDAKLLDQLQNLYWQKIQKYGYAIDGGMREWFPDDARTEGCSVTDWVRLNLHLWQITRAAVYLDEAENAWYNALNFHQTANGAFGHAVCTPTGYDSPYSEAWWCCTMHGLWAYADLVNFAAAAKGDNLWFNFYAPLQFELGDAVFAVNTDYPQDSKITITCTKPASGDQTVHLRIPVWANQFSVTINGKKVTGAKNHGDFSFQHAWKKNDVLVLELPLVLRVVDERGNNLLKRQSLDKSPHTAAFFYGPLLLGADAKTNGNLPDEIFFEADKNYRLTGLASAPFRLDKAHFMLPASANNFLSATTLTPISEQTGYFPWTDNWQNFIRNGEKPIARYAVRLKHTVRFKD